MAHSFDPIQTVNTRIAGNDDVSLALNELGLHPLGYALPPGVPFNYVPTVEKPSRSAQLNDTNVWNEKGMSVPRCQAPLTLRTASGYRYDFPLDPIITANSKNVITRRYVAKGSLRGTVKESWSQDDVEITIAGVLIGNDAEELNGMVQELADLCESGEALEVTNEWLNEGFRVCHLVIESCSFPHTKGLTNQRYSLKCYSDDSINVLEEIQ